MSENETTAPASARRQTGRPAGKVRTGNPRDDRAVREASAAPAKAAPARRTPAATPAPEPATKAEPNGSERVPAYRRHATEAAPDAMVGFTEWILDLPEFAKFRSMDRGLVERLITCASKDYRAFKASE